MDTRPLTRRKTYRNMRSQAARLYMKIFRKPKPTIHPPSTTHSPSPNLSPAPNLSLAQNDLHSTCVASEASTDNIQTQEMIGRWRSFLPVSTIPYHRNLAFFGREDIFHELEQQLNPVVGPPFDVPCIGLFGMSGIGKTQIALEFSYRSEKKFDHVFWIQAESLASILDSFSSIKRQITCYTPYEASISDTRTSEAETCISGNVSLNVTHDRAMTYVRDTVIRWLASTKKRWLLVIDDVQDWDHISSNTLWPTFCLSNSRVIFTSGAKNNESLPHMHEITVPPFNQDTGSEFILHLSGPDHEYNLTDRSVIEAARRISSHANGLPVALTALAKYRAMMGLSLPEVSSLIEDHKLTWSSLPDSAISKLVWHIEQLPSPTRSLLNVSALLSGARIPEEMFFSETMRDYLDFSDRPGLLSACYPLSRLYLGNRTPRDNGSFISIDKFIQNLVLQKLNEDPLEMSTVFIITLETTTDFLLKRSFKNYIAHMLRLMKIYRLCQPELKFTASLASSICDVGSILYEHGLLSLAEALLSMLEEVLVHSPISWGEVLQARTNLMQAQILDGNGISGRQLALSQRQHALYMIRNSSTHPAIETKDMIWLLYFAHGEISKSHIGHENIDAAEEALLRSSTYLHVMGQENTIPRHYSYYYDILSQIHTYRGRLEQALSCRYRSMKLIHEHEPISIIYKLQLASLLVWDNRNDEAKRVLEEVEQVSRIGLPNDHAAEAKLYHGVLDMCEENDVVGRTKIMRYIDVTRMHYTSDENLGLATDCLLMTLQGMGESNEADARRQEAKVILDRLSAMYPTSTRQWKQTRSLSPYEHLVAPFLRFSFNRDRIALITSICIYFGYHGQPNTSEVSETSLERPECPLSNEDIYQIECSFSSSETVQAQRLKLPDSAPSGDAPRGVEERLETIITEAARSIEAVASSDPSTLTSSPLATPNSRLLLRALETAADCSSNSSSNSTRDLGIAAATLGGVTVIITGANAIISNKISWLKYKLDLEIWEKKEARRKRKKIRRRKRRVRRRRQPALRKRKQSHKHDEDSDDDSSESSSGDDSDTSRSSSTSGESFRGSKSTQASSASQSERETNVKRRSPKTKRSEVKPKAKSTVAEKHRPQNSETAQPTGEGSEVESAEVRQSSNLKKNQEEEHEGEDSSLRVSDSHHTSYNEPEPSQESKAKRPNLSSQSIPTPPPHEASSLQGSNNVKPTRRHETSLTHGIPSSNPQSPSQDGISLNSREQARLWNTADIEKLCRGHSTEEGVALSRNDRARLQACAADLEKLLRKDMEIRSSSATMLGKKSSEEDYLDGSCQNVLHEFAEEAGSSTQIPSERKGKGKAKQIQPSTSQDKQANVIDESHEMQTGAEIDDDHTNEPERTQQPSSNTESPNHHSQAESSRKVASPTVKQDGGDTKTNAIEMVTLPRAKEEKEGTTAKVLVAE